MSHSQQVGHMLTGVSAQASLRTGERSAVVSNSRLPVHDSGLGLTRPTPPATDGRNPSARPPFCQPKSRQGAGQSPAIESERKALATPSTSESREAGSLNDEQISLLLDFFRILDRWDRGPHAVETM